jgi:type II secretory pathway component PulF
MIAEEKEKARRDKIAMLHYARHEGRLEGREEGLTLGRLEGEARGRMQLAALLKSGKTLDEALAILQAEIQDGGTASY